MERLIETEKLLQQCEKDLKKLREIQRQLKSIETNRKALDDYYQHQYMADYEQFNDGSSEFKILNQDSIWNVLSDQYNEKIKLIKTLVKSI